MVSDNVERSKRHSGCKCNAATTGVHLISWVEEVLPPSNCHAAGDGPTASTPRSSDWSAAAGGRASAEKACRPPPPAASLLEAAFAPSSSRERRPPPCLGGTAAFAPPSATAAASIRAGPPSCAFIPSGGDGNPVPAQPCLFLFVVATDAGDRQLRACRPLPPLRQPPPNGKRSTARRLVGATESDFSTVWRARWLLLADSRPTGLPLAGRRRAERRTLRQQGVRPGREREGVELAVAVSGHHRARRLDAVHRVGRPDATTAAFLVRIFDPGPRVRIVVRAAIAAAADAGAVFAGLVVAMVVVTGRLKSPHLVVAPPARSLAASGTADSFGVAGSGDCRTNTALICIPHRGDALVLHRGKGISEIDFTSISGLEKLLVCCCCCIRPTLVQRTLSPSAEPRGFFVLSPSVPGAWRRSDSLHRVVF